MLFRSQRRARSAWGPARSKDRSGGRYRLLILLSRPQSGTTALEQAKGREHSRSPLAEPFGSSIYIIKTATDRTGTPVFRGSQTTRGKRRDCSDRSALYAQVSGPRIGATPLHSQTGHFRPKRFTAPYQRDASRSRGVGCAGLPLPCDAPRSGDCAGPCHAGLQPRDRMERTATLRV